MSTDFTKLPIIDLSILGKTNASEEELKSLAKEVRKICETVGFAYLINYESSVKHSKIFEVVKSFFDLPLSSKMKVAKKTFVPLNHNTYRGYFPLQKGDSSYKEGFELGHFNSSNLSHNNDSGQKFNLSEANVWPDVNELPNFQNDIELYYKECLELGDKIMRLIAISFDLDEFYFRPFFNKTVSTLRLLHYPKRYGAKDQNDLNGVQLSCSEHTDSGIITLLAQDKTEGLEVRNMSGKWVPVPYIPESFVVNLGDLMSRWTNGKFVATYHRVRAVQKNRYSIPFFFEPNLDAVIEPLEVCANGIPIYDAVSYGDYVKSKMSSWVEYQDNTEF